MRLISWNCRGFGAALTIKELKDNCFKYKPQMVFLMETKQLQRRLEGLRRKTFKFDDSCYVDPVGLSGGLALWWSNDLNVQILYKSKNIIHAAIDGVCLSQSCLISFVYGPPCGSQKEAFWRKLSDLSPRFGGSWLCVGDYNDILYHSEKWEGNVRTANSFSLFRDWVDDYSMVDLEFKGQFFTWSNGHSDTSLIKERLDLAMGNVEFRLAFPRALIFHVESIESYHCIIMVDFNFLDLRTPKLFRFESIWVEHVDYATVVRDGWLLANVDN